MTELVIQKTLHHEHLCTQSHQIPRWHLWAPPSGLPAQSASAAVQGSPVLPAQTMAVQSSPAVPVSTLPLVVRAQISGRKKMNKVMGREGHTGL